MVHITHPLTKKKSDFFPHGCASLLIKYVGLVFLRRSVKGSDQVFSFLDFCFVGLFWGRVLLPIFVCVCFVYILKRVAGSGKLFDMFDK